MARLRPLAVAAATAAGALAAIGFWLAALFELDGFGTERDTDPRASYIALYAIGFLVSVGAPLALWRRLYPGSSLASGAAALVLAGGLLAWALGLVAFG